GSCAAPSAKGDDKFITTDYLQQCLQEALSHLRSAGEIPEDEHISRLSPLMYGHINMLGHYTFTLPENILKGELRPLNFNSNNELLP
ncbi:Tn3 family transposase, partial [Escherichia coli]